MRHMFTERGIFYKVSFDARVVVYRWDIAGGLVGARSGRRAGARVAEGVG